MTPAGDFSGHVTVSLFFDYLHSKFLLLFTLFSYLILNISGTLKCGTLTNWGFGDALCMQFIVQCFAIRAVKVISMLCGTVK